MQKPLIAAFVLMAFVSGVEAQGNPNALRGLIADRCVDCHRAPGLDVEPTEIGAPDFVTIANDPGTYSDERLRTNMQKPHWPMTQFILSPRDIDNLIAYFTDLRETSVAE